MAHLAAALAFPLGGTAFDEPLDPLSVEFRVRFPSPSDPLMAPTELSGALWNLRDGTYPDQAVRIALWYEKPSATALTGNIYLTSSAGRLQLTSASIFDGNFYNFAVVREHVTGSITLFANRVTQGALAYSTSSVALSGAVGYPFDAEYTVFELGSSALTASRGQFWGQEARIWHSALTTTEVLAHAFHFESYGRDASYRNVDLEVHWRLNDAVVANGGGNIFVQDSTLGQSWGTGSGYTANVSPFTRFLEDFAYIPSIDYGWNQKKIRLFSGSSVEPKGLYRNQGYRDERFVSLEFNLVDALNEDLSHIMSSYDELIDFVGQPTNRYRESYEGLGQMRETYFKRLQGELNFRVFADMLDFFDRSFVTVVQRLLPARAVFKGDEFVVESHMLERPKYQYQLRPIPAPLVDVSGSVNITDLWGDAGR